jgi:epoxyqueuosine reductase
MGRGSWVLPVAVVVDREFPPDEPTLETGCPEWCRNVCIAACPTGALKGPRRIDPRQCISYLTYFGEGITPLALREPMGPWVYGCDRCQNVCPRNIPWLSRTLPLNQKVAAMADDFRLERLLHMDAAHFTSKIWPHMFYSSDRDLWRWQMNAARAMGNSMDEACVPELVKAFSHVRDERVLGMIAWSLGRIGGTDAQSALKRFPAGSEGLVRTEIRLALEGAA